jgi:hypothetical protein
VSGVLTSHNRLAASRRGLLAPSPTIQSEGKSMNASNFPVLATKGIFHLDVSIYGKIGWE